MLRCDVIFQDIQNSERYTHNYHNSITKRDLKTNTYRGLDLHKIKLLIVSSGYWPIDSSEQPFEYPEKFKQIFQKVLDDYKNQYNQTKKIEPHNNLGSVKVSLFIFINFQLNLKFPSGTATFKCQPIHAVIITLFDKKANKTGDPISLKTIEEKLKAPSSYIRSKMFYWIHRGIIIEKQKSLRKASGMMSAQDNYDPSDAKYTYTIVEDYHYDKDEEPTQSRMEEEAMLPNSVQDIEDDTMDEEEHESISKKGLNFKQDGDSENGKDSLENNILMILNNNGPKNIEKIYYIIEVMEWNMQNSFSWSEQALQEKLDGMIKKRLIVCQNRIYYPVQ